jgi:hypothetical protein
MRTDELHHRVRITEEIRLAMREKRLQLGFSYTKAAERIDVHWSTYRKWETGETPQYTLEREQRVKAFLQDDIPAKKGPTADEILTKLMRRQRAVFRMLPQDSELRGKFLDNLEVLVDKFLEIFSSQGAHREIDLP